MKICTIIDLTLSALHLATCALLCCVFVGTCAKADTIASGTAEQPPILDCKGPTGADAKTVRASQIAWAKYLEETDHNKTFPLDTAGKVTIEMVLIPPGKYYRGEGKNSTLITLTQPLWVGKYEVTQQQYEALMRTNPVTSKGKRRRQLCTRLRR